MPERLPEGEGLCRGGPPGHCGGSRPACTRACSGAHAYPCRTPRQHRAAFDSQCAELISGEIGHAQASTRLRNKGDERQRHEGRQQRFSCCVGAIQSNCATPAAEELSVRSRSSQCWSVRHAVGIQIALHAAEFNNPLTNAFAIDAFATESAHLCPWRASLVHVSSVRQLRMESGE
jgi:hypothetical protein